MRDPATALDDLLAQVEQQLPVVFDGDLAATNLTGNYTSSAHWNLDTPAFDFTGVASPQLRFVHWHNFERATSGTPLNNYDGGNIKISTDEGDHINIGAED